MILRRKILLIMLSFFMALSACLFLWRQVLAPQREFGTEKQNKKNTDQSNSLNRPGEIQQELDHFILLASYPITGTESIDATIQRFVRNIAVQADRRRQNEGIKESSVDVKPTFVVTYQEEESLANVRSFLFRMVIREGEGEVETHFGIFTKAFDMKTGREIAINEIFHEGKPVETLASELRRVLSESVAPEDIAQVETMIQPTLRSLQYFSLGKNGVAFFFDIPRIPQGYARIEIPYESIKTALSAEWFDRIFANS